MTATMGGELYRRSQFEARAQSFNQIDGAWSVSAARIGWDIDTWTGYLVSAR
jgi:hypothetical protein